MEEVGGRDVKGDGIYIWGGVGGAKGDAADIRLVSAADIRLVSAADIRLVSAADIILVSAADIR